MRNSPVFYLLLLGTLFTASGASCRSLMRNRDPLAPVVFAGPPTLDDVIYAVNTNSAAVRQLYTESASLSSSGMSLRATMALERPRNFRLRAKFIAPELDVGSNDQLFWFWANRDPENATYYAYHEQFAANRALGGLPIGPDWLIEALGLVHLDPAGQHQGPTARSDQHLEIRSQLQRNGALYTRLLVIDRQHGWILDQQLWDITGRPMARALCSGHRFYQEVGVSLPHRIQVELPSAQLSFQVEVDRYVVNQLPGDPATLWSMPSSSRLVDISAPPGQNGGGETPPSQADPRVPSYYEPRTSYRPRYRGLAPR